MTTSEKTRPNLYLTGFMGTGKSVIGQRLADILQMEFLDSDKWIEARTGKTIPRIFAEKGEARFRGWEREFIETGHPAEGCVVSCGGGLVIQPGMVEKLRAKGVLVCLFASPETIVQRVGGNPSRPLLQGPTPEQRVRELMAERESVYRQAGTLISTECRSIPEVVANIRRIYLAESRDRGKVRRKPD